MVTALKLFGLIVLLLMGVGAAMGFLALSAAIGGIIVLAALGIFGLVVIILVVMDSIDWIKQKFRRKK